MKEDIKAEEVIYKRQSPRNFSDRKVDEQTYLTLLEAARWAASSYNEQPWRFIYAIKGDTDAEERYEKLFACLNEHNQGWAGDAPVLMLTAAKNTFSRNGKPNRHAWHDVGLAMGNFSLQATKMDLVVHQMAGFHPDKAIELFNLPDDIEPVAMAAVGYPAEKKTERTRKPLEELILQ